MNDVIGKGIKTSEFWVTVLALNLLMFSNALGIPLTEVTAGSIAVMVVGYIWARLSVKKAGAEVQAAEVYSKDSNK